MKKNKLFVFLVLVSTTSFIIPVALAPQRTGSLTFSVFIQPSERSEFTQYFGKRTAHFSTDFHQTFDLGWDSTELAPFEVVFNDLPEGIIQIHWMDKTDDWVISYSHVEIIVEAGKNLKVNALIERAPAFQIP